MVFAPGAIAAAVLGCRGFSVLALAAPLSIAAIAAASVVAVVVPLPWGLAAWLITAVLLVGSALGVRAVQRAVGTPAHDPARAETTYRAWLTWLPFVAVAIGVVLLVPRLIVVFGEPSHISQTFDAIYHLNAVRYVLDTGQIAPTAQLIPEFYPSLWHAVTATVAAVSGASVPVAVNVVSVVLGAVVWPTSCVWLTRQIVGSNTAALLAAGALSAGLAAFPLLMLDFGVLYPNVLSLALLPSALAALVAVAGIGDGPREPVLIRWVVLAAVVPTIALAHPSTLMAFFVIGIWPAAAAGVAWFASARSRGAGTIKVGLVAVAWAVGLALAAWIFVVARPTTQQAFWNASLPLWDAVVAAVANGTAGRSAAWAVTILLATGILTILIRSRRHWWLVAGWATLVVIYVVCAAFPRGFLRYGLTGTWYSDAFRITALFPSVVVPLAAIGFAAIVGGIVSVLARRPKTATRAARSVTVSLACVVLVVATQLAPGLAQATDWAKSTYALTATSPVLTIDETALIARLPQHVGPEEVIASNPWTGAALSYALADRRALIPHIYEVLGADGTTVVDDLDRAEAAPAVCRALERTGTRWVLDFGEREVHNGRHPLTGLEAALAAGVVTLVDSEGPDAALYRIEACGLG